MEQLKKIEEIFTNHLWVTIALGDLHGYLKAALQKFSFPLTREESLLVLQEKERVLLNKLPPPSLPSLTHEHDFKRSYKMAQNSLQDIEIFTFCFVGLFHKQEEYLKNVFFKIFLHNKEENINEFKGNEKKPFVWFFDEILKKLDIKKNQPYINLIKECNVLSNNIKHKSNLLQHSEEKGKDFEVIKKFTKKFPPDRIAFVLWREPFVRYVRAFEDLWWQIFLHLEKKSEMTLDIEEMKSKVHSSQKEFWKEMEIKHDIKSDEGKLN